jgi:superfamily I DNA/RNA helicase/mRNA-degrading endonuclease RelE of RelBE toxin-antitoxin system
MENTNIALSDTFFSALNKLDPNIQAKVNQLVLKFQKNPKSPGLNFEKINAARDGKMRSLRVDQAFRVILSAPSSGGIYLFLWVDHHDKAYAWANRYKCNVNPSTGTLQLYSSVIEKNDPAVAPITYQDDLSVPLFDALKDRHLLKLGVPKDQITIIRQLTSEDQLDNIQSALPTEAYEALFFIQAGETYESILAEREVEEAQSYDTNDFSKALERMQSKNHFVVPSGEEELNEILNATMEKWRVFLHSSQRKLSTGTKNGPVRVLGGAGTGKTVVAMHRAKWLAENICDSTQKVFFTTYTKNLAVDIQSNLATICSSEIMSRIEVINIDSWVQKFLRSQSYDYGIIWDVRVLETYWHRAIAGKPSDLDFSDSFYKEEWQRVIQPQNIETIDDYKKASRIGRGTRLNREQRIKIWPVFEKYREQLVRNRKKEADDCYRDAMELIKRENIKFNYSSIVVDEAQDMGTQAFSLLRSLIPSDKNDLFIVGDAHQRIYGRNKVVLGKCGINIIGRSKKLKINYRTTDEIRRWAVGLLENRVIDDLDGGNDDNSSYKSLTHGHPPVLKNFDSAQQQAEFIKTLVIDFNSEASNTCVVARTNREISLIEKLLSQVGVDTSIIKPSEAETKTRNVLKLATIHRVKGLEFDQLILASANEGLIPLFSALEGKADESSLIQAETEERSLVYVAITRARKQAFVLSYGRESNLIKDLHDL